MEPRSPDPAWLDICFGFVPWRRPALRNPIPMRGDDQRMELKFHCFVGLVLLYEERV